MNVLEHKFHYFGPYLTEMKVDDELCDKLLTLGKTLKEPYNHSLVGQIKQESLYDLEKDTWISKELEIYINTWISGWQHFSSNPDFNPEYRLNSLWINETKAKEYNPIHHHINGDLSFIIWLEVPEEMINEAETNETAAINPGNTGFIYGEEKELYITQRNFVPMKNTIMIFPADLRHFVMHFNSNVTRTSVSGNISFLRIREDIGHFLK